MDRCADSLAVPVLVLRGVTMDDHNWEVSRDDGSREQWHLFSMSGQPVA